MTMPLILPNVSLGSSDVRIGDSSMSSLYMYTSHSQSSIHRVGRPFATRAYPEPLPRYLLSCDRCQSWHHGECVNIPLPMAQSMTKAGEEYICATCRGYHTCPMCFKSLPQTSAGALWHHISWVHVTRNQFPSPFFIRQFNRLICSVSSCHSICHDRFRNSRQNSSSGDRCGVSWSTHYY